ncbi:energy transducer TonB [Adhaeribacter aquaticus]|uniref:energy transducer TonB n=1 Tax=Adhaeribacter aquaticus TaxID=299567 RepID=UPI00040EA355|nr:energy transducer TonB [Adhaeribacter aquaticus]
MKVKISALFAILFFVAVAASAQTAATGTAAQTVKIQSPPVTDKVLPAAEHYEGGQAALYAFINKEMVYPPMAKRNRISGQCIVSFTLQEDGSTANHKIIKNVGGGCGEEALRLVKLLQFKAPGYSLNTSLPINFKL